ncbi:MAG: PEGA domain-containing protein [Patescibacteria group bacterium]
MSLATRRTLFYLYILAFLIVAPAVVMFTAGYRFDFTTGQLVQVGALSVTSVPRSVAVYLDDGLIATRTPALAKRVVPGEHELRLSKTGYTTFQKTIDVRSRETSIIENAILFLDAEPTLRHPLAPTISAAASGMIAYGVTSEPWFELWVYNVSDDSFLLIDRLTTQEVIDPELTWTHDSTLALSVADGKMHTTHFYSSTGPLTASPYAAYSFVALENGTALVTETRPTPLAVLSGGEYEVIDQIGSLLLVREWREGRLVVVDTATSGPPILLDTTAEFYHWQNDTLYVSDGFELRTYVPSTNIDTLITRTGTRILDVIPYPFGTTVFVVTATDVTAVDIDDPSHVVATPIVSGGALQSFLIDARGRQGYFFGTVGEETGLFQIPLTR